MNNLFFFVIKILKMFAKLNLKFINFILLFICTISADITYLNEDNFDMVINSSKVWLIEVYSEKCESCKSFESTWKQLIKNVEYLNIGRINVDEMKGINAANKINALENGIPAIKLIFSKENIEDIMTGIEEPLPNAKVLKKRIIEILEKNGKYKNGNYINNEEL